MKKCRKRTSFKELGNQGGSREGLNNINFCICRNLGLQILHIFVFVQDNNYLLHSMFTNYSKKPKKQGVYLKIFN